MNKTIKFQATDLASRSSGAVYRQNTVALLKQGERVEFHLENVLSMSESFADELFGVLVQQIGEDELTTKIRLVGANSFVLDSIVSAIRGRTGNSKAA